MNPGDLLLRSVNLNLLPVLAALLRFRNVSHAAAYLDLAQSSVSASLQKLRSMFDDELLVPSGRNLVLTPRAEELRIPLADLMERLTHDILQPRFDEDEIKWSFRIGTADFIAAVLAPPIARILTERAPGIRVEFVAPHEVHMDALDRGELEALIAPRATIDEYQSRLPQPLPLARRLLWTDELVGIAPIDLELDVSNIASYAAAPSVGFQFSRVFDWSPERALLSAQDLERNHRVVMSNLLALPWIVSRTRCVAVIPDTLWHLCCRDLSQRLRRFELPFEKIIPKVDLVWLERVGASAAHRWLRELIREAVLQSEAIKN
ncbi:MAG: LysR family transcriptional regulator [Myxococcota bacterium]